MNFYIHTLGCKVNSADSAQLAAKLYSDGDNLSTPQLADVIYVAGCMVTSTAEKKSRKAVSHYKRLNPNAEIRAVGCTVGGNVIARSRRRRGNPQSNEKNGLLRSARNDMRVSDRVRPLLKVQDGCNQGCAYCIVCQLRGPLWSLDIDSAVEQVKQLADSGTNEIVLCGINLGLHDDLLGLLKELVKSTNTDYPQLRFRLSSLEVNHITQDLLALIAQNSGKICRHLHIPLQAGCDKMLQAMGRPYTSAQFSETIKSARQFMPQIAITTDIIVGFPGETDDDFAESLQFAKTCGFSKIHVFPFSTRPGTVATEMTGQVTAAKTEARALAMRQLSDRLSERDIAGRAGTTETVVVEKIAQHRWCGKTESYIEVSGIVEDGELQVGDVTEYRFQT